MRYLKATGIGLMSAVSLTASYVCVKLVWSSVYVKFVLAPRAEAASVGGSWDVFYPQTLDLRGPLVIGFVIGFWWMVRRHAVGSGS